jgi:hypothetical protein
VNVWFERLPNGGLCELCAKKIKPGDVAVKYVDNKRVVKCHPDCWVDRGIEIARTEKVVVDANRGRKPKPLTVEQREMRLTILKKFAAIGQRIRELNRAPGNEDRVLKLILKQGELCDEIEPYGGIPGSWQGTRKAAELLKGK